ncbi:MAG: hypothetical protein NW217_03355 [Hyphomicrobiaceae bacterium]|nr:hypothetical protein [Hyphomicrobiaceae bacterium]
MDIEQELNDLKRRVGDLEGAMNVLAGRMAEVHPEIVSFKQDQGRRLDRIEGAVARLDHKLDNANLQVWALRDDLPAMLQEAVKPRAAEPD